MKLRGVGQQNRRCVLLFAYGFDGAFPGGRLGRARVARTLLPEPPHQCQTAGHFAATHFARTPVTPAISFSYMRTKMKR